MDEFNGVYTVDVIELATFYAHWFDWVLCVVDIFVWIVCVYALPRIDFKEMRKMKEMIYGIGSEVSDWMQMYGIRL